MSKGIVIAGTHSGCGKTTITLGLMTALKKRGLKVQPFKAGPDFIDAGLHRMVTGRPSRNLDLWMCGEEYVRDCFYRYSQDADMAIIEGVMGMYDGEYSTARLAGLLNLPVILVVDAYGMAESAGAIVRGFVSYSPIHPFTDSPIQIAGVVFNRVASENHFRRLKDSIQDVTVLGYLPRNLDFEIPHRHLGLIVAEENPISQENLERLGDVVLQHIDIDLLVQASESSGWSNDGSGIPSSKLKTQNSKPPKIAVAYDRAFCFYYEDNLDLLKDAGAEIITFSPLSDSVIPADADAVYIGGGYPELYAGELSGNISMLKSFGEWADSKRPIYAECGGLMYLSRGIYDPDGNFFPMAGIFSFETRMKKERAHLGYREILLKEDCILGRKGERLRGHEFHYSEMVDNSYESGVMSYELKNEKKPRPLNCYSLLHDSRDEGYVFKNTLASYVHVHFGSNPCIAQSFVNFISQETEWKRKT